MNFSISGKKGRSGSQPEHPAIEDPEALLLKTAEHLPGQAIGHGIGFNQN
jgi:hypothetical protein